MSHPGGYDGYFCAKHGTVTKNATFCNECEDETPTDVIAELTAPVPLALVPRRQQGIPQLLEVVDDLRAKVASGQVVAFAAVGVEADDVTLSWQGCTQGVTNLRLVGAVARLMHGVHTDIDE